MKHSRYDDGCPLESYRWLVIVLAWCFIAALVGFPLGLYWRTVFG